MLKKVAWGMFCGLFAPQYSTALIAAGAAIVANVDQIGQWQSVGMIAAASIAAGILGAVAEEKAK